MRMCFHMVSKFISLIANLILGLLQVPVQSYLNEIQIIVEVLR